MDQKGRLFLATVLLILAGWADVGSEPAATSGTGSPFIYPEYSKKISMDFQSAALVDVLKIFSKQTNLNLITAENIASKRITIFLDNVPVEQALEQLLKANDLTYEIQPDTNIYIVKPLSQPDTELITRVYPLKHATVSQSKLKKTLNISLAEGLSINSSDTNDETGIKGAIMAILSPKGKITEDPRTNSFIITDIATNFSLIENTIARLDVPIPQIMIEVEMLEVSQGTTEKIGVKIGDTPLSFTGGKRAHVYPWDQNKLLKKGQSFQTNEFDDEGAQYYTGIIDASGLTAALQFLKTQSGTKTLARPSIMTLNNETAQIKIAADETIGVSTQTESSQSIATQSLEAERAETGVFLTVTPQANVETEEITMALVPKVILARDGQTFSGQTFRDPEERGTQSILRVLSGETIIIGGLMREEKSDTITKVPLLGDIPVLGQAFRHKDESHQERELIIFITPRIIKETERIESQEIITRSIIREQDFPSSRFDQIEKELRELENK
ncbi:MAG TPA: secretin N-terminal domain-containing protein [Candidatus Omnitrophota bacterium]|nr:secretin and TonB N-terminal domain-containing protein [Candidatus Omnitrophota bacterium]HQO58067.1 secretin N-terminal domain-containing protein [Candidatus Omnitrophota bacterium]HQP12148.1 secretin N-terminal domain-containing protein [Candidatus Omnitrophota bacterium]